MKKRWVRISLVILIILLLIPLLGYLAMHTPWGKAKASGFVSDLLTNELGVDVHLGEIQLEPMRSVEIKDILILDHHQDTLLWSKTASASISIFEFGTQTIHLDAIELKQGLFRLKQYEGEAKTNLQPVIDRIKAPRSPDAEPWDFAMNSIQLQDMRVERIDQNKEALAAGRFNAADIRLKNVNGILDDISLKDGAFAFHSHSLRLEDQSGLVVNDLSTYARISGSEVDLKSLELKTPASVVSGDMSFDFSSGQAKSLGMKTNISQSEISLQELGHFIPGYEGLAGEISLRAEITGTLEELLLRDTYLSFGQHSKLSLDGLVKGLPDINNLWLSARVHRFESDISDLKHLPVPMVEEAINRLPEAVGRFGAFEFSGDYRGTLKEFYADGRLQTQHGAAEARMDVHLDSSGGANLYDGYLALDQIDLGAILQVEGLGVSSTHVDISLIENGVKSKADIAGVIDQLSYRGYIYRDIDVDAKLEELLFNGSLAIHQAEVDFGFKGLVDLQGEEPRFDFEADVFQLDLGALGLVASMDSSSMTGQVKAQFEGNTIDDFEGSLKLQGLSYCTADDDEYYFEDIDLMATTSRQGRLVELRSSPIDASVDGVFKFADLKEDFLGLFDEVFPSLTAARGPVVSKLSSDFGYAILVKDYNVLEPLILPGSHVSDGTMIAGRLDSEKSLFSMNIRSDSMRYAAIDLEGINLDMERVADVAYLAMTTDDMYWGDSLHFNDNYYTFNAYRDSLETDFTWSLPERDASGSISLLSILHTQDSIRTYLYPSQMVMSGDYWLTQGTSQLEYASGMLSLSELKLSNGEEVISLSGDIGETAHSRLQYAIDAFSLEHLNKFLPAGIADLAGVVTLDGHATSILGTPTVVADLLVDEFHLGGERVGDIDLHSTWSRGEEYLLLRGGLEEGGRKAVLIDGKYYPKASENNFDAQLSFDGFDLGLLNRLPLGAVSGLEGKANGELELKGTVVEPLITGELDFEKAKVHVNYLNTDYTFSNKVKVRKNYIAIDYIPFQDSFGNKGNLNGTVIHENYRNWNYDIFAEFENLLVLNTDETMNELFFGTVYGTGSVSLFGFDKQLTIEVFGKTEKNTVLELPLGSTSDVELEDFVYFKRTAEEDSLLAVGKKPTTGIDLFIEAEVTQDAQLKLIFDEKIGDVVEGNGEGTLTMTLDKSGVFEMFGNYMIADGDYLFTLQNIVNKRFNVAPGSMVSFYGDPLAAELDLTAIYKLRAPLSDLLPEYGELYSNRTLVNCEMILNGELFNPDIAFDISFPDIDPSTETLARSKLNTEEELNRQMFSLLILNKFLSSDVASVNDGILGAANTGTEFASAQLSNWLSQISDDLDIGVNYRAADNINSEELAVALSTQLFNDRLLLSGNFGVQGTSASSTDRASSVIGDFRLEYFILPDGRLRLKVFSESNDNTALNLDQAASKQGVGLVYQREFDGLFDEFKQRQQAAEEAQTP